MLATDAEWCGSLDGGLVINSSARLKPASECTAETSSASHGLLIHQDSDSFLPLSFSVFQRKKRPGGAGVDRKLDPVIHRPVTSAM
jgi:hypothetical protein